MLYHPPKFSYCGLTIILSNPSRLDKKELLEGTGGWIFNEECLRPETNRYCCDIRLAADTRPLIKDTKCLLLLGQRALETYGIVAPGVGLSEQRGSPVETVFGIPGIASYPPQDAVDPVDFESRYNRREDSVEDDFTGDKEVYLSDKSMGKTQRANFRFWLRADTKKALKIVNNDGIVPGSPYTVEYKLRPPMKEVVEVLSTTKEKDLFYDIETDLVTTDMRCLAFCFGPNAANHVTVYIVPTLDINYTTDYTMLETAQFMRALAIGFQNNTVVAHNGAYFDYFVLAWKYRIPMGPRLYDTMISNQRIYPDVEKSLGHCISYWTFEPYHKNEGVHTYRTPQQAKQLYEYCGKDVFTMVELKMRQLEFADSIPGLRASIDQANASIRPYLIANLLGMHYDETLRASRVQEYDRLMTQYMRCMKILTGPNVPPLISNQKCTRYFHDMLGYKVVGRSAKTRAPSLAKDDLYKLKMKLEDSPNPVIDLLIRYRKVQKDSGLLQFNPWRRKEEENENL